MNVLITTKLSDGKNVHMEVRPVVAWAWLHTLRTGDEPNNMQQILDWAQDEMYNANIASETINDMITDEIKHIMQADYKPESKPDPKPAFKLAVVPEPEIA